MRFGRLLWGLRGVVIGAGINEVLRRSRRVETFSPSIFEKRLARYEKLMELLNAGHEIASEVMTNSDYTPEERHALISEVILNIAKFTDREELYINPELGAHCVAVFMGAEDVLSIKDLQERESAQQQVRHLYVEAKRMIREDSGVHQVENLFKSIHKPQLTSPIIDRIRYLKANPLEHRDFKAKDGMRCQD